MSSGLPVEVERFIVERIASIAELEILLLLRIRRDRSWTTAEIATEMRTSDGMASSCLDHLTQKGLVATSGQPPSFVYAAPDETDAVVATLATSYLTRRFAVIDAILRRPPETTDKIRLFADAFRFRRRDRKRDPGGGGR